MDTKQTETPAQISAVKTARRYFEYTNSVLGIVAFNIALACISTASPKFFGLISLVFVITTWGIGLDKYRKELQFLSAIKHPEAKPLKVLYSMSVALLGTLFLALVAFGVINTNGII